jgi:PKD repeat protein
MPGSYFQRKSSTLILFLLSLSVVLLIAVALPTKSLTAARPAPSGATPTSFAITALNGLGGNVSWSFDINNQGQAVGYAATLNRGIRPFVYSADKGIVDLSAPDGDEGMAFGINNIGHVVGRTCNTEGCGAFLYTPEQGIQMITSVAGAVAAEAWSINDSDLICGKVIYEDNTYKPFVYDRDSGMTVLNAPGWGDAGLFSVNNSGQAVGWADVSGTTKAFTYSKTTGIHYLDIPPGGGASFAYGINESGQIAMTAVDSNGVTQACRLDPVSGLTLLGPGSAEGINDFGQIVGTMNGRAMLYDSVNGMRDLNNLIPTGTGWSLQKAVGINNSGQITGYGSLNGSPRTAFLLAPPTCALAPYGMVAWWTGDSSAVDIQGGHNGVLHDTTFVQGEVNQAFSFNGISSYVTVGNPAALKITDAITLDAWVNPDNLIEGQDATVISKWGQSQTLDSYTIFLRKQAGVIKLVGAVGGAGVSDQGFAGGTVIAGQWTHVSMTYDALTGSNILYVNGQQVASRIWKGGIFTSDVNVLIGLEDSNLRRPFSGSIDEVHIYNRALSALEIQSIYQSASLGTCKQSNSASPITNIRARQLADGSNQVEILYDLAQSSQSGRVALALSNNGGGSYNIQPDVSNLSGDLGQGVSPENNKRIIWRATETLPAQTFANNFRAALIFADDSSYSTAYSNLFTVDLRQSLLRIYAQGSSVNQHDRFIFADQSLCDPNQVFSNCRDITIRPTQTARLNRVSVIYSQFDGFGSNYVAIKVYDRTGGTLLATSDGTYSDNFGYEWYQNKDIIFRGANQIVLNAGENYVLRFYYPNAPNGHGFLSLRSATYCNGCSGNSDDYLNVYGWLDSGPISSFSFTPASPTQGQVVQFSDSSSGAGLSWEWDFTGDGFSDSSEQNPTYAFSTPGPHPVTLKVKNAYGSNSLTQTINVNSSGGKPFVNSVVRSYPGVFLQNSDFNNRFDVGVNWQGSPGTVRFSINGAPAVIANGTATGASRSFNMNSDFPARLAASTLTITPVNSQGVVGVPWTENIYVFPFPSWLELALLHDSGAFQMTAGDGEIKATIHTDFPDPHLGKNGPIQIPSWVPYIGGEFGLKETYARLEGQASSTGLGRLTLSGQTGFAAMGQSISGKAAGSGEFRLIQPNGLILQNASFNLNLDGTISKTVGVVDAIPQIASLQGTPVIGSVIRKFNEKATLTGEISPSLRFGANFAQDLGTGKLKFRDGTGTLGLKLTGRLDAPLIDNRLTLRGWVSGDGSITVGVPDPLLREMRVGFQAGVDMNADFMFSCTAQAKFNADCTWQYSTGQTQCTHGSDVGTTCSFSLFRPDYARAGRYNVFRATPRIKTASAKIPVSVQESSLASNIFPGASPQLVETASGKLLLWVHQNPDLPVTQSTDISWAYFDGTNWSAPAFINSDTQAELSPVAAVDASGKVVVAWLRVKDTAFSAEINSIEDLPLFYTRLEVVSAVFDPSTKMWGPITTVTDDTALDTSLRLSSDGAGNLLLTWLSNDAGEFTSTSQHPSSLKYSFWNGSAWSSAANVATNLAGVSSHAAAVRGAGAFIILPRDPDANVLDDGVLELYLWNGTAWSQAQAFAAGGVENSLPSAVYDASGAGHIVWLRGQDLVHATLDNTSPQMIRSGSTSLAFYNAKLLTNAQGNLTLIWQEMVDNGPANIFAMIYDPASQTWSADRRLTEDPALSRQVSGFYGSDGQIHLAYLATEINRVSEAVLMEDGRTVIINNIPEDGQTDLRLLEHSLIVDLAVTDKDLTVSPEIPQSGDAVTADVDVHNAGDFAVNSFAVKLYVGAPGTGVLVGSETVTGPLAAGEHRVVHFSFNYPATAGNIVAWIDDGDGISEFSETNNRATYYLTNSAPQVRVAADVTSGSAPLLVNFDASSSFDAENDSITFNWAFADGSNSASGSQVTHTFNQTGLYPVTVSVTDPHGAVGTATVTINVGCQPLQFTPVSLSDGRVGAAYNQPVSVSGGNEPYAFAITAGALPAGLSLSSSGEITGMPLAEGTSIFTVTVSHANSCITSRDYTINIEAPCNYALSEADSKFRFVGGSGSVDVFAEGDCNWTAVSNDAWINITSGNSGAGDGTVAFTVMSSSSSHARTGTLTIAGLTYTVTQNPRHAQVADFDGDGRTDISVWQADSGKWHIINSTDSSIKLQFWGQNTLGDVAVPGDYDGDGKTDIAVWRPEEGNWYIISSLDGTTIVKGWGLGSLGDKPVPADYDGDGKIDIAVWRAGEGNWYIINSSSNTVTVQGWGAPTDKPVPADYDGDGRADIAVWRPSEGNWYILQSTGGLRQQQWGLSEDKPVPADYDGDGIADIAVWRPSEGNWYIVKSGGGIAVRNWGASTDQLVPGDYDGDGKIDIAVRRPSEGTWYIIQSGTDTGATQYLGYSVDIPIPSAYLSQ